MAIGLTDFPLSSFLSFFLSLFSRAMLFTHFGDTQEADFFMGPPILT